MALVEYAEDELKRAGWFDEDGAYYGLIGPAVMELMKQFASEGHSGGSARLVLGIFDRVSRYRPLTPLENPMATGEYRDVSGLSGTPPETTLQSTRLSSLFSNDSG